MSKEKRSIPISSELTLLSEPERLKKDVFRSDVEKLRLFTQMLRRNKLLKKAVIHHK